MEPLTSPFSTQKTNKKGQKVREGVKPATSPYLSKVNLKPIENQNLMSGGPLTQFSTHSPLGGATSNSLAQKLNTVSPLLGRLATSSIIFHSCVDHQHPPPTIAQGRGVGLSCHLGGATVTPLHHHGHGIHNFLYNIWFGVGFYNTHFIYFYFYIYIV